MAITCAHILKIHMNKKNEKQGQDRATITCTVSERNDDHVHDHSEERQSGTGARVDPCRNNRKRRGQYIFEILLEIDSALRLNGFT